MEKQNYFRLDGCCSAANKSRASGGGVCTVPGRSFDDEICREMEEAPMPHHSDPAKVRQIQKPTAILSRNNP